MKEIVFFGYIEEPTKYIKSARWVVGNKSWFYGSYSTVNIFFPREKILQSLWCCLLGDGSPIIPALPLLPHVFVISLFMWTFPVLCMCATWHMLVHISLFIDLVGRDFLIGNCAFFFLVTAY